MTISTRESLSGFIASDPQLTFTDNGDARFYARIGQEHFTRNDDGTFEPHEPTYTDLVMFRKSAERAFEQLQKGDNFIAEGEARTWTQHRDGQPDAERDQFVARRIGHDNNRTTYTVDRTRTELDSVTHDSPGREDIARDEPGRGSAEPDPVAAALATREANITPDTPTGRAKTTRTVSLTR